VTVARQLDVRAPEVDIHGSAGRALALNIPVTGGVITSPVLTMRTGSGDPFTADPGVGTASMPAPQTLRLAWTAPDMAALNTTTRPVRYRFDVAGVPDGLAVAQVLAGTLTVYPTTRGQEPPANTVGTLVLTNGVTFALDVTVPTPDGPIDGGYHDDRYGGTTGYDGGSFDSIFTDTTYDGGNP
jgi:hypothetical protein